MGEKCAIYSAHARIIPTDGETRACSAQFMNVKYSLGPNRALIYRYMGDKSIIRDRDFVYALTYTNVDMRFAHDFTQ